MYLSQKVSQVPAHLRTYFTLNDFKPVANEPAARAPFHVVGTYIDKVSDVTGARISLHMTAIGPEEHALDMLLHSQSGSN